MLDFEDVEVIPDPEPDGHRSAWRSHHACLEAMPISATHLLAIQDDALPIEGFHARIMEAVAERPESVLLPFVPGFKHLSNEMRQTRSAGEKFMRFRIRSFVPVVAIIYPAAIVHDLLQWTQERGHRRGADDGIVSFYCRARRIVPAAMVPCICDHDAEIKTVGAGVRRGTHRRAALL